MNLKLASDYLFFPPFECELPSFTVITGKNGSGKTILLKLIKDKKVVNDIVQNSALIQKINSSSFEAREYPIYAKKVGNQIEVFEKYLDTKAEVYNGNTENKIKLEKIAKIIAKFAKKDVENLTSDDFIKYVPLNIANGAGGLYNLDFYWDCLYYADRYEENLRNEFLNKRGRVDIPYYSEKEFNELYGEAPWVSMNKIFDSMKIEYNIEISDTSKLAEEFQIFFIHKSSGGKVQFSALSTGEQVIILTAFSIFNVDININVPQILLMDEPDASLHPSMIKDFLRVLEDYLVKEKGIYVILTTHSPTTVALAPEKSIFVMSRTGEVLKKATKDSALKVLTEGVPSFSVNYENRRQVFVESDNDVKYYDRFYTILKNQLHQDISLNFISSGIGPNDKNGMPTSNCEQVLKVTLTLRENGNNSAWGIIDWDRKDHKHDLSFVKILGNKKRYSIENYIFDPIAVAAFLLRKKIISNEALNIDLNEDIMNFTTFTNEKLQDISDIIVNKIEPFRENAEKIGKYIAKNETITNVLVNGRQYDIPLWVNELRGHILEDEVYIKAFPELERIKNKREDRLKLFIINEVFATIPDIIPVDIKNLFVDLQAL